MPTQSAVQQPSTSWNSACSRRAGKQRPVLIKLPGPAIVAREHMKASECKSQAQLTSGIVNPDLKPRPRDLLPSASPRRQANWSCVEAFMEAWTAVHAAPDLVVILDQDRQDLQTLPKADSRDGRREYVKIAGARRGSSEVRDVVLIRPVRDGLRTMAC